ncbi:MAG: MlaD family protein [Candidatus Zipacnadales bacterium]
MSSETKTGIVALFVIAAIVFAWSKLGGINRLRGEYTVIVCFDDLHGLPVGAPVRLAGVKIGEVRKVALERHPPFDRKGKIACATLCIGREHTLFVGDIYQVASGSLVGDKYLKVSSGVRPGGRALDKNKISIVEGSPPAGLEALAQRAEELSGQAQRTLAHINSLMADQQMRADLKAILSNMRELSLRATAVANKALSLMDELDAADARKVESMVENLYEASQSLRRTAAGVNALVATTTVPQDIETISDNLTEASEAVRRSVEAVEALIADPKTSEDIRTTLENVRDASDTGVEVAEKASGVLDKVDRVVTRVDNAMGELSALGNPFRDMETSGYSDVRLGSGPAGRIDVGIDFYPNRFNDKFYRLGVRDLGGEEKLDLQGGFPLGHRGERIRVGVFEGDLGVGWDRRWSSRLSSEIELIDPDEFRLDMKGKYRYNRDWELLFGLDRTLSGTEPFLGARRHFDF